MRRPSSNSAISKSGSDGEPYVLLDNGTGEPIVLESRFPACQQRFRRVVDCWAFRGVSTCSIIVALFGSSIAVILDLPDDPSVFLMDVITISIMIFFLFEVALRCVAEWGEYPLSFFFWSDLVGTVSLVFDISFLLGDAGNLYQTNSQVNAAIIRCTRASRIGSRAARLIRPIRLVASIFRQKDEPDKGQAGYSAKVLGAKLTHVFSSKVAMLTLVLVLGVPLFNIGRYPEDDFSMRSWGDKLELDYYRDYLRVTEGSSPVFFKNSVEDMESFYAKIDSYFPYKITGYDDSMDSKNDLIHIPGQNLIDGNVPTRKQNIVRMAVECKVKRQECDGDKRAAIYFNFTAPNIYNKWMDVAVTVFIVVCMVLESCDLSASIDALMVQPMERMLDSARLMAKQLHQALNKGKKFGRLVEDIERVISTDSKAEDIDAQLMDGTMSELDLLQGVFKKVVFLLTIFIDRSILPEGELEVLDDDSKAVAGELNPQAAYARASIRLSSRTRSVEGSGMYSSKTSGITPCQDVPGKGRSSYPSEGTEGKVSSVMPNTTLSRVVLPDGIDADAVNDLNFLDVPVEHRFKVIEYIFYDSPVGELTGRLIIDNSIFKRFYEVVEQGYLMNPYTSFVHNCDVLHGVYKLLIEAQWHTWLCDVDCNALLIAALASNIGHPGRTNAFLIETSAELAMTYNDKSPLENMHCAKLFEICRNEPTNVFSRLSFDGFRASRIVCVEAILHTDNAYHFDMIKEVKKIYGMASDICDAQTEAGFEELSERYKQEVLAENTLFWLNCFLHISDISNQCKAFPVAKRWAIMVMEEFYDQGDEEKRLAIPIGLLNDREKITVPAAQYGFINVLLSPLMLSTVYIFPQMHGMCEQMAQNMEVWLEEWKKESAPPADEMAKREDKLAKMKGQVAELGSAKNKKRVKRAKGQRFDQRMKTTAGSVSLEGLWTCTNTWGLSAFLKHSGVNLLKRKAAESAPWPSWEYQQSGNNIVFINHSAMGKLREDITVNGQTYTTVDGWKQTITCRATWESGSLVIEKDGPQGKFREERTIDHHGRLQFVLQPLSPVGPNWGRTFEKKPKK